jgi:hypothetical protein
MAGKRNQFTRVPSSGDNKEGDKLYKKYEAHIKKHGGDITNIDDMYECQDEYDLNVHDCNWIRTYTKTNLGYAYPSNAALLQVYMLWYKMKKSGQMEALGDHLFNDYFRKEAIKHNPANAKKEWNEAYLRRKMQRIVNAIMLQTGRTGLPNPCSASSRRSAKDVVKAADLSLFLD